MNYKEIIDWLLKGDVSIQYQTCRDLLKEEKPKLQAWIAKEGWGAQFLSLRNQNGHWGMGFYQPKWTSTHYTLLDLKNLQPAKGNKEIIESINQIIREQKGLDGGINPAKTIGKSDVCINGMFLNYACFFGPKEEKLKSIVDFILSQQMNDGGFNCRSNRTGAVHSSLHTTISVLEGILEYSRNKYTYRLPELKKAEQVSQEFILEHKLFQSHRTGETIDRKFLMLSYPYRWRYDILRAMDYFQSAGLDYDVRMVDAVQILINKRRTDNTWPLQEKHKGKVHFDMEQIGKPSRWNTLRALRVLERYDLKIPKS